MPSSEEILKYFDIAILVIIGFFALIGFFRGTKKSLFYMICTLIIFVGGWLLMGAFYNLLLDFDLSSFNIGPISISGKDYELNTCREFLTNVVTDVVFGGNAVDDSVTLAFVLGVVGLAVKLVYFILLIILSFTLFKILSDIIWLFFKPKKKLDPRTGKKRRAKPSAMSRFGGAGIGAVKGLIYALLICFLIAGVSSIATDVNTVVELQTQNEGKYAVIMLDNKAAFVQTEAGSGDGAESLIPSELKPIIDVLSGYRTESIAGQVFGAINLGEKDDKIAIDEYIFDGLLSIDIKNKEGKGDDVFNISLSLRKELRTVSKSLAVILEADPSFFSDFSVEKLTNLESTTLKEAIDELSKLDLIKVVVPVGLEVVLMSDIIFSEENVGGEIKDYIQSLNIDTIRNIDYGAEFKNIGYAFVDIVDLCNGFEDFDTKDLLSFDPTTVQNIFNSLGSLGLLDIVAPIAIEYVLSMDSIKDAMNDLGMNLEDLKLDEITSWGQEISKLGTIFSKFLELSVDGDAIKNGDYSSLDLDKVSNLVEAIFDSAIINRAIPLVATYAVNLLPEDYSDIISIPQDVDWKSELEPLVKGALLLLKTGIITAEDSEARLEAIKGLTDDGPGSDIDLLGKYLSSSSIIKNCLNGVITQFLTGDNGMFGSIEIKAFTEEEVKNGTAWSAKEISSIFRAILMFVDTGVLEDGFSIDGIKKLNEEEGRIDKLADALSGSLLLRRNLSSVFGSLFESINSSSDEKMKIETLSEDEWTNVELSSIFHALIEIIDLGLFDSTDNGGGTEAIMALTEEQIDSISENVSKSKFFTRNFTNLLNMIMKNVNLDGIEIIGLDDPNAWTKLEIKSILLSAKTILYYQSNKSLVELIVMSDEELEPFLNSQVISNALASFITSSDSIKDIVKGSDKVENWGDKIGDKISFGLNGKILSITDFASYDADRFDIYVDDDLIGYTTTNGFDFTEYIVTPSPTAYDGSYVGLIRLGKTITSMPDKTRISVKPRTYGEVRHMFEAISMISGMRDSDETNDIINYSSGSAEIDKDKFIKNLINLRDEQIDKLTESIIMSETIKDSLLNLNGNNGLVVNDIEDMGTELKSLLYALRLIFGEDADLNSLQFETNDILNKIIDLTNNINAQKGDKVNIINKNTGELEEHDADEVGIILGSKILSETIGSILTDKCSGPDAPLVMPEDISWGDIVDAYGHKKPGEIRSMFNAIHLLFPDGEIDINKIDVNRLLELEDDELDTLLASKILDYTLRNKLIELDTGESSIIVVNEEKIDKVGWDIEIKALIHAFDIVLEKDENGKVDLNNPNVKIEKVLTSKDSEQTKILSSIIITDTFVKQIYQNSDMNLSSPGPLSIPVDNVGDKVARDADVWYNTDSLKTPIFTLTSGVINITNIDYVNADRYEIYVENKYVGETTTDSFDLNTLGLDELPTQANVDIKAVNNGEVRKLFAGVQVLFEDEYGNLPETISLSSINADSILDLNDEQMDRVLASETMVETVKDKIISLDTSESTGTSTIYVDKNGLEGWTYNNWRVEIKALLDAMEVIVEPDVNGKRSLENAKVDMDTVLAPENKTKLLSSRVISDTIIGNLKKIDTIEAGRPYIDWYGADGELSRFIDSANVILRDSDGHIGIENFDANNLLKLKNNIGEEDDEVAILLESYVLRDTMAKNIIKLSEDGVLVVPSILTKYSSLWNDDLSDLANPKPGEIRSLLTSVDDLLGEDKSLTNASNFGIDKLMSFSKAKISEAVDGSLVISYTIAKNIDEVLYEGAMKGLIAEPSNSISRLEYVRDDHVNMIYTLQDLKNEYGINYDSLNYSAFQDNIDSDAKAYFMSETITQSQIFTDSLGTMFGKIFKDNSFSMDASVMNQIINELELITPDQWRNVNPTIGGNYTYKFGELALLLRTLTVLTDADSATSLSTSGLSDIMNKLNASKALQPVLPSIMEKALASVEDWKRSDYSLTQVEWSYEIDVLIDLVDYMSSDVGENISGVSVQGSSKVSSSVLTNLITKVSKSRILDVNRISDNIGTGVDAVFGNGTFVVPSTPVHEDFTSNNSGELVVRINASSELTKLSSEIGIVSVTGYSNADYDDFVDAWSTETAALVNAVEKLNEVSINLFDMTGTGDSDKYQGVKNARSIGKFLDAAKLSHILEPSIDNVLEKVNTIGMSLNVNEYGSYEECLAQECKNKLDLIPF